MKTKILVILILVIIAAITLYASIGAGDFSSDAKKGWSWHFTGDHTQNFSVWEPQLKAWLEIQGQEYNTERINSDISRKANVESIRNALRGATDAQIEAALAALGL
jgi:hypothetical protein